MHTQSHPGFVVRVQRQFRYALGFHVHDQRLEYSIDIQNSFKLSSPTLRKLCLPCITARHHSRSKSSKVNARPRDSFGSPTRTKKSVVESFERFEPTSRSHETVVDITTTAVHSSDYSRGNNANNFFHEPQQSSSHSDLAKEKKSNENSLEIIETQPTSSFELVGESLLQPASVLTEDVDVVGILYLDFNPNLLTNTFEP